MAIDDNLHADAIAELEVSVGCTGPKGYNITLKDVLFIFGVPDTGNNVNNQVAFGLIATYLEALGWIDRVDKEWALARLVLYSPNPSIA